mgnify:CR=1 FL=1
MSEDRLMDLIDVEKPRKNLTQETFPDLDPSTSPLREWRTLVMLVI